MSRTKVLITETYTNLTIDAAKQTASVYAPYADHVTYVVVASAASSPTGTTIQVQGSIDGTNFVNLSSTVSVTGNGNFTISLSQANTSYVYYRLSYARTSGSYVASTILLVKGEEV